LVVVGGIRADGEPPCPVPFDADENGVKLVVVRPRGSPGDVKLFSKGERDGVGRQVVRLVGAHDGAPRYGEARDGPGIGGTENEEILGSVHGLFLVCGTANETWEMRERLLSGEWLD
jgi:hypothetical protein